MNFSPHPKIHTIGSLENKRLFEGIVWVQEKVDGSQYKKELANVGSGNDQKDEPSGSGETGETGRESLPVSGNPRIGLGDLPSGEGGETGEGKLPA